MIQRHRGQRHAQVGGLAGGEHGLALAQPAAGDGLGLVQRLTEALQLAGDGVIPAPASDQALDGRIEELPSLGGLEDVAGDREIEGGGGRSPLQKIGEGFLDALQIALPAAGEGALTQAMAQRLGIDRLHIALSAEDRIDLSGQQAQLGAAPEHLRHRFVVAKPDAAPEQSPALAMIIGAAEHGSQEILLVEQQLTGRHGRHW